jgi:hypothetical protein
VRSLAIFGIDRARGKGLSRGWVKLGLYHGISLSVLGTPVKVGIRWL